MKISIGVIGGGAAGMVAAIAAARDGAEVTIIEGGERIGKKILSTGNGKCNFSNRNLSTADYYCERTPWLEECLKRFGTEEAVAFFEELGMLVKDKGGYLYPASEQAATVLDVLRFEIKSLGIRVVTDCKVTKITKQESAGGKYLVTNGTERFSFDKVILACGGKAMPRSGSDGAGFRLAKKLGHRIVPAVPALVQLTCSEDYLKAVTGVRCEGEIAIFTRGACVARERGEIQLTEYGISGIPTFQLSRIVNYLLMNGNDVKAVLDLLPDETDESYESLIERRKGLCNGRSVEEFFCGLLNKKLMMLFIKRAGLNPTKPVETYDPKEIRRVYELCRHWELHVAGSKSFDNAQVTAGGVDTKEVSENMESLLHPGLYIVGELLDVDGRCGGYNLHWAWCSGYIAGCAAARI